VKTALIASTALVLAGCGDPLFFGEVEEPKICFRLPAASVPAAPALPPGAPAIPSQTVESSGELDLGSQIPGLDQKGTTGSLRLLSLSISSSADALSHIDAAEADLPAPGGALAPFVDFSRTPSVGSYTPNADGSATIDMKLAPDTELFQAVFANGGKLPYRIALTGTPPTVAWTVAVDFCMYAKLKVDVLQAVKSN
jgi:hypothetical protein